MFAIRYSRCPVKFLLWILVTLLSSFVSSVAASLGSALANVTVFPPYLDQLKEHTNRTVWISVSFQHQRPDGWHVSPHIGNTSELINQTRFSASPPSRAPATVMFEFKTEDESIARLVDVPIRRKEVGTFDRALIGAGHTNSSLSSGDDDDDDGYWMVNASFTVEGLFLGKTVIGIKVFAHNEDEVRRTKNTGARHSTNEMDAASSLVTDLAYNVWVVRHDKKLAHIFVGTLLILLIVANVLMGAQLNLSVVYDVLKKPLAPAIGFVCQFILMPLISYTLARVFFVPTGFYNLALGLFTTGCCPGGGASNAYTVLLDGNVDLSVTMTFLSTLLSLAMMPMWMFALGRQFLITHPGQKITIPYTNIMYSLLMLVLPLCGGVLLRRFFSKVADHTKMLLRPFLGIIIVFICTFGVYVNLYMFRLMTWRVLVGGMALPWLGFFFGLVVAALARQPKPNVVAISIETGIQNTGIAIMLLQLSFAQPDADLASVLPVVVAMFTPIPMVIALVIHYVSKWRNENEKKKGMDRGVVVDACEEECFA